ncbi:hypothetical protein DF122_37360 [Burkholderia pseudomallei]|nr:hypothetical protein CNX72_26000 [Burkholderia pseudomallei]MWA34879.1 hypothetical protein [Burkholderia pseudomallei]NRD88128.1 hypothetical protein [Burkholderia pseudomallei]NRE46304.1 hypothetical protein [Burkholderia pseudomallei]QDH32476.1 hypothetical protein FKO42_36000 [Burkholderia pseudomallei]
MPPELHGAATCLIELRILRCSIRYRIINVNIFKSLFDFLSRFQKRTRPSPSCRYGIF